MNAEASQRVEAVSGPRRIQHPKWSHDEDAGDRRCHNVARTALKEIVSAVLISGLYLI